LDPATSDKHRCIVAKVEVIDSAGKPGPARLTSQVSTLKETDFSEEDLTQ
jgi:hypothetical protein